MIQAMANRLLRMFAYITRVWNADEAWDEHDDGLVFNPASPRPVSFLLADGPMQVNHDFVVNSDGKLSHNLWLLCGLVALFSARPHLDSTFFGLLEWAESGREVITALTELKARLVHIQGYVERLCHLHDRESVGDDMEDTGDSSHGSTSYSLSFPHSVSSHSSTDNDPESDGFAQPPTAGQVQPRPSLEPRDTFTHLSITSAKGSRTPDVSKPKLAMAQLLGTGPQDPRTSFSLPASQALSQLFQIPVIEPPSQLHAARQSYQETPKTVTTTQPSQATVSSSRRARSRSAEGEWPSKRVRRCSDSVVVNHEGSQLNRLTRATVKFGTACQLLDAHEPATEDDAVITGPDHYAALLLARIVMGLCYGRYRPPALKNGQRGIGMTAADLGELLDETPDCMPRTRSALLLATSERSIVESCAASWGAILEK
ncbi:hypothetical protein BS17DRAFT_265286 [Gyrodon lividus]|nr:hypothetical protein BS17DRAFT_265286 [Gyrodon lividus]